MKLQEALEASAGAGSCGCGCGARAAGTAGTPKKKLLLDHDTGIDDALAIAYAVASPEVDLIGVCGTYGNVLEATGVENALAILDLLGRPDVPVYHGEPHSLTTSDFEVLEISAFIHGQNGVGEAELVASDRAAHETAAVDAIIDAAYTYGEDLIYVPTGPLTNLAAALRKDPSIASRIGQVVLMGGALTVPGNVSPCAEANISQDPVAANEVFTSGIRATMIGLDVTLQTLLTYADTARWREVGTPAALFLANMTDYYIRAYETTAPHLGGCGLHDPLAVAVAVDPTLVTTLPINMMVETSERFYARTIGDPTRLNDPVKTMQAAVAVDAPRFLNEFMTRLTALVERV